LTSRNNKESEERRKKQRKRQKKSKNNKENIKSRNSIATSALTLILSRDYTQLVIIT
jgi:hypothetical protein